MDREEVKAIMMEQHWSKDQCVGFALSCTRSLIDHAPDEKVSEVIAMIEEYVSLPFEKDRYRALNNAVQPIAVLRVTNEGKAREVCHAALHAAEAALSGSSMGAYGHTMRSWAAINAADPELAVSLVENL